MRPRIILQPVHQSSTDILECFAMGKPLSNEKIHFLEEYEKRLSSTEFDPILQYYLQSERRKRIKTSFLLPYEELNFETIQQLKKRIALFLQNRFSHVVIGVTQKQFLQFKELNIQELIFWHGNQFLTGAPMFPGGIPPVIYFQWGNFFGVVKYVILAEEKSLKSNLLIYFEDIGDRSLDQCVIDYNHKLKMELNLQNQILLKHKIEDPPSLNTFLIKTPTLTR